MKLFQVETVVEVLVDGISEVGVGVRQWQMGSESTGFRLLVSEFAKYLMLELEFFNSTTAP